MSKRATCLLVPCLFATLAGPIATPAAADSTLDGLTLIGAGKKSRLRSRSGVGFASA